MFMFVLAFHGDSPSHVSKLFLRFGPMVNGKTSLRFAGQPDEPQVNRHPGLPAFNY